MLHEICIGLYLGLTLNNIETFAKPVEVIKPNLQVLPFQLVNITDMLAYQGFDLNDNNLKEGGRKKRFLDDLINLFSWLEDFEEESEEKDDDEDTSSQEEESSVEQTGKEGHDICCNCSVTINKVKQVQHLYHDTHKVPPNESFIINTNKNQQNSKSPIAEENIQSVNKTQEKLFMTSNEKPAQAQGPSNDAAPAIAKAKSPAVRPALTEIPAVAKASAPVDSPGKAPALAKPLAPQEVPAKNPAPAKVKAELPAPAEISTKASPPTEAPVTVPVPTERPAKAEAPAKTEAPVTSSTEAQAVKALADNNSEVPIAPETVDAGENKEAPEIPEEAPETPEAEKEE